jgi:hypothetical protein
MALPNGGSAYQVSDGNVDAAKLVGGSIIHLCYVGRRDLLPRHRNHGELHHDRRACGFVRHDHQRHWPWQAVLLGRFQVAVRRGLVSERPRPNRGATSFGGYYA